MLVAEPSIPSANLSQVSVKVAEPPLNLLPEGLYGPMRYDRRPLIRFLLLAIPLLVMIMAPFGLILEMMGVDAPGGFGWHPRALGARIAFGSWILESVALTALFLLAKGRAPAWWLDGLLAGWLAWLFRGPVVLVGIAMVAGAGGLPWRHLAIGWWILYTICGLTLAILARSLESRRS